MTIGRSRPEADVERHSTHSSMQKIVSEVSLSLRAMPEEGSMFRRIESIASAAVWSGFDGRTSPAPDFGRYNLIYGWSASGKTTLSRVFGLVNGTNATRLPAGARVRISMGQDVLDSAKEQDCGRVLVRIFNRDFIDDNLQRDDYTHAPALFIVGRGNIRLSNRIASLTRRRERLAAMYRAVQKKQSEVSGARERTAGSYSSRLTTRSSSIRSSRAGLSMGSSRKSTPRS